MKEVISLSQDHLAELRLLHKESEMNMIHDSKIFGLCRAFVVISLLPVGNGGCSDSDLGGSTALSSAPDSSQNDSSSDGTVPKSGQVGPENGNQGGSDDKKGSDNVPPPDDKNGTNSGGDHKLKELIECLKKKPFNYNVVIVLDNSNSQTDNDPQKVRQAVSLDFVNKFNGLVARKPDTTVQISVVSFSATATESSWTRLDGKDDPVVPSDPIDGLRASIVTATTNEKNGTKFGPAFEAASKLLKNLGPPRLDAKTKNYVLFMTDGEPYDSYSIPTISAEIVDENKAAVLAIASGSNISKRGEAKVEGLAIPKTGDHIGRYYRAVTADDMKTVWSKLFEDLVACN